MTTVARQNGATDLSTLLLEHLTANRMAHQSLECELGRLSDWGRLLADHLSKGGRLLVAGNGGSAALASHLSAELVGRYTHERPPHAAIALSAEAATVTALANDYGYDHVFARQVAAFGLADDVLLCLSTSGRSPNLLAAVEAGCHRHLRTWALTGPAPNPLAEVVDDVIATPAAATATVQEVQQTAVHLLCAAFDAWIDP